MKVIAAIDWKRLGSHMVGVVLVATIFRFLGYAAAISYAAAIDRDDVDARKIADHTFYVSGCIALAGDLLYLALER